MRYKSETKGFRRFVKNELNSIDQTNRALADEIGATDQQLSNWLNGYVKLDTFKDKVLSGLNRLKENAK